MPDSHLCGVAHLAMAAARKQKLAKTGVFCQTLYKDARKQLARFEEFVRLNNVLPLTLRAATISAQVFAELRKTGKIIGHNDVLIAGIALEQNMVLITNNTSHFNRIDQLIIDNWIL